MRWKTGVSELKTSEMHVWMFIHAFGVGKWLVGVENGWIGRENGRLRLKSAGWGRKTAG